MFVEGNDLLVLKYVFHISDGLLEFHSFDSITSFVSVLVVGSKVIGSSLGSYGDGVTRDRGAYIWLAPLVVLCT